MATNLEGITQIWGYVSQQRLAMLTKWNLHDKSSYIIEQQMNTQQERSSCFTCEHPVAFGSPVGDRLINGLWSESRKVVSKATTVRWENGKKIIWKIIYHVCVHQQLYVHPCSMSKKLIGQSEMEDQLCSSVGKQQGSVAQ